MAKKRKVKSSKALTFKEANFVAAYLGDCHGNGVAAAVAAGYRQTYKALKVTASRLLTKANIQTAIRERQLMRQGSSIITADRRDEILSDIAESTDNNLVKITAIKELNKCSGRHSVKHVLEGRVTLEQALASSWNRPKDK